jgi:hypothetical protein
MYVTFNRCRIHKAEVMSALRMHLFYLEMVLGYWQSYHKKVMNLNGYKLQVTMKNCHGFVG